MSAVVHLLDVNVLIALVDPAHVSHERAHEWFGNVGKAAFATCPLTENGLLRIVGHPKYPNSPGPPGSVMPMLTALRAMPGHQFWPDSISLGEGDLVDAERIGSHERVTDCYLLALAKANRGKLATLDAKLSVDAVTEGRRALVLI